MNWNVKEDWYTSAGIYWNDQDFLNANYGIARVLVKYHQVTIADPEWSRNDRLWSTLTTALDCKLDESVDDRLPKARE